MKAKIKARLLGAAVAVLAVLHSANGAQIDLAWDPPLQNSDGSAVTNLTGFRVHYGTASGVYDHVVDLVGAPQATIGGLAGGQRYFFAVTAYTAENTESALSDELVWDAPPDVGNPPSGPQILSTSMEGGASEGFSFSWGAEAGKTYVVEMSADLFVWEAAASGEEPDEASVQIATSSGVLSYRDVTSTTACKRFYRIRQLD